MLCIGVRLAHGVPILDMKQMMLRYADLKKKREREEKKDTVAYTQDLSS